MSIRMKYHTMIVSNMEESIAFYKGAMGLVVDSKYQPNPDSKITLMRDEDGNFVELIENKDLETGLWSIRTDVDDLDKELLKLEAKGIERQMPVVKTSVGRMTMVMDPNGVRIYLIEHDEH